MRHTPRPDRHACHPAGSTPRGRRRREAAARRGRSAGATFSRLRGPLRRAVISVVACHPRRLGSARRLGRHGMRLASCARQGATPGRDTLQRLEHSHLVFVYRAPCGGGAEKRNLVAPSPWCCKQRRATTAYRLLVPLGTPPLLKCLTTRTREASPCAGYPAHGSPASHVSTLIVFSKA